MPSSTDPGEMAKAVRRFSLPHVAPCRILGITGRIKRSSCIDQAETVRRLDQEEDSPILFVIDSPRGESTGCDVLSTVMSFCRSPTIGLVVSRAASAGFRLLQACDLRLALASSFFATHFSFETGSGFRLTSTTTVEALTDSKVKELRLYNTMWSKDMEDLCRRTGLDSEQAMKILQDGHWLLAREAFQLGFIDGIAD